MEHEYSAQIHALIGGECLSRFERLHSFLMQTYNIVLKPDPAKDGSLSFFYRSGGRALCALHIKQGAFTAQIVLGKAEQERFAAEKERFSAAVCALYDDARPYHDGKWLFLPVDTEAAERDVCALLLMKKRPNKKRTEQ